MKKETEEEKGTKKKQKTKKTKRRKDKITRKKNKLKKHKKEKIIKLQEEDELRETTSCYNAQIHIVLVFFLSFGFANQKGKFE